VVIGVHFPGRRPRGSPVFQVVGAIEKNWLRFAIKQLKIVLALFYHKIENRSVSPRSSAALVSV
jgi:hypothetical protein